MRYLRTNTAARVTVGPFFDKTDGVTPETALTVTSCKLTLVVDDANVPTLVLDTNPTASGGANDMVHITGDDAGFYDLELAAANVNYVGRAMLALTDAATHCPVFHEFMILPAVIYDSMILGTDLFDVSVTQFGGTNGTFASGIPAVNATQISGDSTAADNLETAYDDTAGAVPWDGIVDQGTAQSASSTGLVLRSAAAFADNTLVGAILMAFGSTQGYWQTRVITANALSGDTVTVDTWTVTPSGTITYKIYAGSPASTSLVPNVNIAQISGDSTAADNLEAILDGTGANLSLAALTVSAGVAITQSTTNGNGLSVTGNGTGHGAVFTSGSGATGQGMRIIAASTNGSALLLNGSGSGAGLNTAGGATGHGISTAGGSTSGDGISAVASTSGHGITATGVGTTKHGINATGGATTSAGISATGGSTSGDALLLTAATSGHGINAIAAGTTKHGINATGGSTTSNGINAVGGGVGHGIGATSGSGATGNGINATSAATAGDGFAATGNGVGNGATITSGSGATGAGLRLVAASTNGSGLSAAGVGSGSGISAAGGASGNGITTLGGGAGHGISTTGGGTGTGLRIIGGSTSGAGIAITTTSGDGIQSTPTAGHGMVLTANGTSKHGLVATGGGAGTSDGIKGVAGTGGVDFRAADVTANATKMAGTTILGTGVSGDKWRGS